MERLNYDESTLRKFGITMAIAFMIITFILSRHKHSILPTSIISLTFFIIALFLPLLLKPIYIFWMRFAFVLGWINTRLISSIIFYLIFTAIGMVIKLFGFDLLDRNIDKNKKSYWHKKETKIFNPLDYERQF